MFRTLCVKLSVLALSFVMFGGVASAQPVVDPFNPFVPAAPVQPAFTDADLETVFRHADPNVQVQWNANGTKTFVFKLRRASGVEMLVAANVSAGRVRLVAMVTDPFLAKVSVEEINRILGGVNDKVAPVSLEAHPVENGKVAVFAIREIGRTLDRDEFLAQWGRFFQTAENLRTEANAVTRSW